MKRFVIAILMFSLLLLCGCGSQGRTPALHNIPYPENYPTHGDKFGADAFANRLDNPTGKYFTVEEMFFLPLRNPTFQRCAVRKCYDRLYFYISSIRNAALSLAPPDIFNRSNATPSDVLISRDAKLYVFIHSVSTLATV